LAFIADATFFYGLDKVYGQIKAAIEEAIKRITI